MIRTDVREKAEVIAEIRWEGEGGGILKIDEILQPERHSRGDDEDNTDS